jgi:hypothetical protein
MLNIVQMNSQIYLMGYQSGEKRGRGLFLEEEFLIKSPVFHGWKIDRPDGVNIFEELLFIKPYALELYPTVNPKKLYFLKSSM